MDEGRHRLRAETEYRRDERSLAARPDRIALWAVVLAVVAMLAGAASADAGSGGVGSGGGGGGTGGGGHGGGGHGGGGSGSGGGGDCAKAEFGKRTLAKGDCGSDVETLNWLLKAGDYRVPLRRNFGDPTHNSVQAHQRKKGLRETGVVNGRTRKAITGAMKSQRASWYGPGFYGNRTACGQKLQRKTEGVAHRNLPCGTKVVIGYHGRYVRARVIDRGPYVKRRYSRDWDLTSATARDLHFTGTDKVRTAVVR